jgi:hypothetical protein
MKTVEINIYQFSELSEEAKQNAIEQERNNLHLDYIFDEATESLQKFANIFSIKFNYFDFLQTYSNDIVFKLEDNILQLSGQRLATYLWNNHKTDLYKGKYYSLWSKTELSYVHHKNGHPVLKKRRSKIILDNSCVLTGVCYDQDLLDPIYRFLEKPTDINFEELLNDCIQNLCKSVESENDFRCSDEGIIEDIESNDFEFEENGDIY